MSGHVLLFAGTSEGRELAERLNAAEVPSDVCVATAYGEEVLPDGKWLRVLTGRMDEAQMTQRMREVSYARVVDATHPYAAMVSVNIRNACAAAGVPYLRLLRASEEAPADCHFVASVEEAAALLAVMPGKALITTGCKELAKYTAVEDYRERLFVRVLPTAAAIAECDRLGIPGKHRIAMQGPFSREMNEAMLRQTGAEILVTKESGAPGGFAEKMEAARAAGAEVICVNRPVMEEGYSLGEICGLLGLAPGEQPVQPGEMRSESPRRATLVGIGMGDFSSLTGEVREACEQADVILGARRMLRTLAPLGRPMAEAYLPDAVQGWISGHPEARRIVIAFSGDAGFYSGAKRMAEALAGWEVRQLPGISSPVCLCARLGIPWEDAKMISMHGRRADLIGAVRSHPKVFSLVGGVYDAGALCRELTEYGFGGVTVHIGRDLSYPEEEILHGTAEELAGEHWTGQEAVLIENPDAGSYSACAGLPDEAFVRGKVPMTKEEIRALSIRMLRLPRDAVVWDIGAGTGSVSVEIARLVPEGAVYAVERNPEALALLAENRRRLAGPNLHLVSGAAPEALTGLPAPTHVFIGGSGGRLPEILSGIFQKNPKTRVVITAVTLETTAEIAEIPKTFPVGELELIQVSAARAQTLGGYHMMRGRNPVMIAAFAGQGKE